MAFCTNCGQELIGKAKFCAKCGEKAPVLEESSNEQRKIVYEGEIHKCPNCGEVLASFTANCPACGYEIRGTKTTSFTKDLIEKLAAIDARQMPIKEQKRSVVKAVFGSDFSKDEEKEEEEREYFEDQKKQEKANLIISYPVPATREGILDFMLLTSTNINTGIDSDDDVAKAWKTKMEQVYKQAELIMQNGSDLAQVRSIYNKKKAELKNRKFLGLSIGSYMASAYAFLMSALFSDEPGSMVAAILVGIGLVCLGIKFTSIFIRNKKDYT